jgi:uncharacterized protein YndB with AHSA1/START domain
MKKELIVQKSILIDAPPEVVWNALTEPEMTKYYMYGSEIECSWEQGSTMNWKGVWEGNEMIFVTGKLVSYQPMNQFSFTAFNPHSGLEDIPANHTTVTYLLRSEGDKTHLQVTQGDFSLVPDGEKRYQETMQSWDDSLGKLIELIQSLKNND